MVDLRWPNGITCPRCGSERHAFILLTLASSGCDGEDLADTVQRRDYSGACQLALNRDSIQNSGIGSSLGG
jgi:hypothetical protein